MLLGGEKGHLKHWGHHKGLQAALWWGLPEGLGIMWRVYQLPDAADAADAVDALGLLAAAGAAPLLLNHLA